MRQRDVDKPRIFVAGATGMVGSAICRRLSVGGYPLVAGPIPRIDLANQQACRALLKDLRPDWLILAAAKVGGIHANASYPADFIYTNLLIQSNVLHSAWQTGVEKLLFLGSSCIYPRLAPQPIKEEYLLSAPLEPTNRPYAVAKIAGIVAAQSFNAQYGTNFICAMPSNLYGPHDCFDLENSHVIPALLRKTHEAKIRNDDYVEIWGSGKPLREFLHVDDLADACVFLMENYNSSELVNIGSGTDISIQDLALLIKDVIGFRGEIRFDPQKPDGMPRKLLDVSKISSLGWAASISLRRGLASTYQWYVDNQNCIRK